MFHWMIFSYYTVKLGLPYVTAHLGIPYNCQFTRIMILI
jgi:hypothetical protein